MRIRTHRIAWLVGILLPVSLSAQSGIPTYDVREELRIVSSDVVPGMLLTEISGATVLPDGRILTVHPMDGVVRVFDPSGRLLTTFGRRGHGPGEFVSPNGIGYFNDTIWVRDFGLLRYVLFGFDYRTRGSLDVPRAISGGALRGEFLGAVSGTGSVGILRDGVASRFAIFGRDGELVRRIDVPTRLHGRFEVENRGGGGAGRRGDPPTMSVWSPLSTSTHVLLEPGGREVVVVESAELWGGLPGQLAVRRISTGGGAVPPPVVISLPARRVTAREADSLLAASIRELPQEFVAEYRSKAKVPDFFPVFTTTEISADGTLWLGEHGRPGSRLVIDRNGRALMRVRFPKELRLIAVNSTHIWGEIRDADDLPIILRYRIER